MTDDAQRPLPGDGPLPGDAGPGESGPILADTQLIGAEAFRDTFGESLDAALDLSTWPPGGDLVALYHQLEEELAVASRDELSHMDAIRRSVLPRIARRPGAPDGMGFFRFSLDDIRGAHRSLLFNGGVEAVRATVVAHETLALTVTQLGISLVSYHGDRGTWGHRLFRRDLRSSPGTVEQQAVRLIQQRQAGAADEGLAEQRMSMLARRGILAYAERSVLLNESSAPWRLGAGNPVPFELLTGAGSMELATRSTELLQRLVQDHGRFVFVSPQSRERGLLTVGNALAPLEYVVLDNMLARMRALTERSHFTAHEKGIVDEFVAEIGPEIVMGIYRASEIGQPRIFYGHRERIHEAALIAIADSVLHEHRAFPLLLDLAEQVCRGMFPPAEITGISQQAHIDSGLPLNYVSD
ncbi:MAG TPA: hypothetical protein VGT61_11135 [Thermomicrobiales bacterium]|jgi:hypothetical protein|nr:hypothetical protein [Thermomicrobiales bacterium]